MSTNTSTTSIRAWYKSSSTGRLTRGYKSHIDDNGFPLCRYRMCNGFTSGSSDKWVVEFSKPTCPVCLKIQSRQVRGAA